MSKVRELMHQQDAKAYLGQRYAFLRLVKHVQSAWDLDVTTRDRRPRVVTARNAVCWVLREMGWSYPEIGRHLKRDHTSIMSAVSRFNQALAAGDAIAVAMRDELLSLGPPELPAAVEIQALREALGYVGYDG